MCVIYFYFLCVIYFYFHKNPTNFILWYYIGIDGKALCLWISMGGVIMGFETSNNSLCGNICSAGCALSDFDPADVVMNIYHLSESEDKCCCCCCCKNASADEDEDECENGRRHHKHHRRGNKKRGYNR